MSKQIDDGGPAYPFIGTMPATGVDNPIPTNVFHVGMKLRDWFAGQALSGVQASLTHGASMGVKECAEYAYEIADAMLAARKESPNDQP